MAAGPFLERKGEGVRLDGPAIGLVETTSIARGIVLADAMVKRAVVTLAFARPVTPGKHVTIVTGDVGEVEEAMGVGVATAAHTLVDRLFLPAPHETLLAALHHGATAPVTDALGIVETFTVAAAVVGADAACKAAGVALAELRLADGIGGKAYFLVTAELDLVEAAVGAAERTLDPGLLVTREIIPRPHADLLAALARR